MRTEGTRAALVTNATDFAGQPATDALLSAGFRVLAHDKTFIDQAALDRFSSEHPGAECFFAVDPASLVAKAWEVSDRLDVIVSNDHHPAIRKPTDTVALDELRRTLEALVIEPFALVKESIPYFKAQSGGKIVMITSCRTRLPMTGAAIPDAARAAANALVRSLAIELAPFNIAVNAIAPNFLYSEAYYPRARFIDDQRGQDFIRSAVPMQRLGRPEEIGEVIRFLAESRGRFLTGAVIDFAGGWPASPLPPPFGKLEQ